MIDKEILLSIRHYEHPYQKEKNYLQELFLSSLYNSFDDSLVFKGGTALSKFYGSGRFSDDLDFCLAGKKPSQKEILIKIEKIIGEILAAYPTKTLRKRAKQEIISYELSIRGPLFEDSGKYQHLKIEIDTEAGVIEGTNTFRIDPPYQDLRPYVAVVMSDVEILAEKVVVLLFRHTPKARDLYDLYFLIKKGVEIRVKLVDKKMREYGHTFSAEQFERRMKLIEGIWGKELTRLLPKNNFVSYDSAEEVVIEGFRRATLL